MARRREAAAVELAVLRVFCGPDGGGGNELGVVLDGDAIAEDDRQALARHLGYSETVFVDDARAGRVRIFTPEVELPFAGHPVVGTGWLLAREGFEAEHLLTPAGRVELRHDDELTWAVGEPDWCPPFELIQLDSPAAVDARQPDREGWRYAWAWLDEPAGEARARCFVPEAGIAEDEATGSAALRLSAELGRDLVVHQGRGSEIRTRRLNDGRIEIGGRVVAT